MSKDLTDSLSDVETAIISLTSQHHAMFKIAETRELDADDQGALLYLLGEAGVTLRELRAAFNTAWKKSR